MNTNGFQTFLSGPCGKTAGKSCAILRAAMESARKKKPDFSRIAADIALKLKSLGWSIRNTVRVWCSEANRILARITGLYKQGAKKLSINKVIIAHTHA